MTNKKTTLSDKERQAKARQKKLKAGLQQVNAWLDEQTLNRLNELAKEDTRTETLKKAINLLYEERELQEGIEKNGKDSGFGSWG